MLFRPDLFQPNNSSTLSRSGQEDAAITGDANMLSYFKHPTHPLGGMCVYLEARCFLVLFLKHGFPALREN